MTTDRGCDANGTQGGCLCRRDAARRPADRRGAAHRGAARRGAGRAGAQRQAARPAPDRVGDDLRGRARAHPRPPGRARVRRPQRPAVDASVASLVTESLARRYQAIPIGWEDGRLVVAMADPSNVFAVDDIRAIAGAEVRTVVATARRRSTRRSTASTASTPKSTRSCRPAADDADDDDDLANVSEVVEDAPIVKFVNLLVTQAVADRASDIHVEPTEHDLRIRFRIDGVLHEVMRSPRSIQAGVISRLKVMADINIAERRIPQDGRISHEGRRARHRPPRRDAADGVRREGRHADPRQGPGGAAPRGARASCPRPRTGSRRRTASRTARSS